MMKFDVVLFRRKNLADFDVDANAKMCLCSASRFWRIRLCRTELFEKASVRAIA